MDSYLLGIDIGTQGSKGVLVTTSGVVVAMHSREHAVSMPHFGWAEHDAERVWWADCVSLCHVLLAQAAIDPRRIEAVGVSALSPDMLPLDAQGHPLRPAILYGIDTRATKEIIAVNTYLAASSAGGDERPQVTHQDVGPKMLWLREHEPECWSRTAKVVSAHGYIVQKLTGACTIDYGTASGFAPFYDAARCRWREDVCRDFAVPVSLLPELARATTVVGTVHADAATVTGLAEGTPVIAGVTDFLAEVISAGAGRCGDIVLSYGSTMTFLAYSDRPVSGPGLWSATSSTRDLFPGRHAIGGGMATSASLIRWFRDNFAQAELRAERELGFNAYQLLSREAESIPWGSDGLIVLPYFSGERSPIHDPGARGMYFGLTLNHTRTHCYHAILEGIAYGLCHHFDLVRDAGGSLREIAAVGGGTRNRLWTQIISDVTDLPQDILSAGGAPLGDAYLAGCGIGLFNDLRAIRESWVHVEARIEPNPTAHACYRAYYAVYRALYERTKEEMHVLDRLSRETLTHVDMGRLPEEVLRVG